ncbi:MAG: hypothetical protein PVJ76_10580 [Gemmatimonadota bacterium]|jgi:hypothetical protein
MRLSNLLVLPLLGLLTLPAQVSGQGFNGRARTYVSYLNLQELVLDSLPESGVEGEGSQRVLPDGTRVTCGEEYCHYYRSGSGFDVAPLLQDIELNAWSGITGLRGYAHVRLRKPLGDRVVWPRSDQAFEALAAYVDYSRGPVRLQAGRIWDSNPLGFFNYDGGAFSVRLPSRLEIRAFGGRSLLRGLNQPHRSDLITSVESLGPDENAYLAGVHARWRPHSALSASLTYQRETMIQANDLYSERIGGSARVLLKQATLEMEVKYDLAQGQTNLARVSLSHPLGHGLRGTGELKKYVPFFQLWTLWGAFSPVGYTEGRARLDWMREDGRLAAHAYGGYRKYAGTGADAPSVYGIRDDSWRLAVGGQYRLQDDLTASGELRYDEGYGSTRSGGDLSLMKQLHRDRYLAIQGTAFETFSEFRVGSGRVIGVGLQGGTPLGPSKVQAGAMYYRHSTEERPTILDLNQARAHLSVEIPIGSDPGLAGRGGS